MNTGWGRGGCTGRGARKGQGRGQGRGAGSDRGMGSARGWMRGGVALDQEPETNPDRALDTILDRLDRIELNLERGRNDSTSARKDD